jgi:large subunit ribosomal protein L13
VNTLSYKTVSANKATANKEWVVVDADGQPLGRLASKVAKILRGKHKTNFTPHVDCGDNVIVLNAESTLSETSGLTKLTSGILDIQEVRNL